MKKRILSCVIILLLVICMYVGYDYDGKNNKELYAKVASEGTEYFEESQCDSVNAYLFQLVPELHNYADYIIEKSNGEAHLTIQVFEPPKEIVDEEGDDGEFYAVYVGEQRESYRVNWDWFYVESNLTKILWYNLPEGEYYTLDEWRQSKYYRNL